MFPGFVKQNAGVHKSPASEKRQFETILKFDCFLLATSLPWWNMTEDFKNKRRKKANSHSSAFHLPGSNALSRSCINRPPKVMMTMSNIRVMMIMRMMIMIIRRMMMRVRGILNIVTQKGRSNSIIYRANVFLISKLRFHLFTFISQLPATALQCNIMREILQKLLKKTTTIPE